jgi:hypothetical protein
MAYTRPHTADVSTPDPGPQRHIGILLLDGIEELDAVGPWEVLCTWTQQHPKTAGMPSAFPLTAVPCAAPRPCHSAPTTRSRTLLSGRQAP